MISKEEWRWAAIWAVVLVGLATLPYLVAWWATPDDLFYTGFLTNPEDGHTYLAKMRQGLQGHWLFHLPYTPEPHQGAFLLSYYLALGHLARWSGLPLIGVFHLARAANGLLLLLALYAVAAHFFQDVGQRRFAWAMAAVGSGLGWLFTFLGAFTIDLWVPEGYVFYSLFVNPHFPLAMALMLLVLMWSTTPWGAARIDGWRLLGVGLGTAALGIVQPFALATVGFVLAAYILVLWLEKRRLPRREIAAAVVIAAAGLPFVANAYLVSTRNAAFAAWSAQNRTPSPPLWNVAAGYGLVLLLGLAGLVAALRRRRDGDWLLSIWALGTAVLIYAPLTLQRRLILGWIVPLGMLGALGWTAMPQRWRPRKSLILAAASLTHAFLLAISPVGALTHSQDLFITTDERAALAWLAEHAAPDALVIAAPQTGLYIPAWAGQRVVYGHHFETANAEQRRVQVMRFFQEGDRSLLSASSDLHADYVFYGPQERALSGDGWQPDPGWRPAFERGAVTVYALPQQ